MFYLPLQLLFINHQRTNTHIFTFHDTSMSLAYYESKLSQEHLLKINRFLSLIVCYRGLTPLANIAKVLGIPSQTLNLRLNDFNRLDRKIFITDQRIETAEQARLLGYVGKNVWQTKLYRPYETLVMYFYAVQCYQDNIAANRKRRGY